VNGAAMMAVRVAITVATVTRVTQVATVARHVVRFALKKLRWHKNNL
jgi:hypothetical protein